MARFEAKVTCRVFARVWVEADSPAEAKSKVQQGGGFWGRTDFEKHTAEDVDIESIEEND